MDRAARIAAWLDSYRRDLKSSLHAAAEDGFPLVTVGTLGELDPRAFGQSARRHFRRYVRDLGLDIEASAAIFPGAGLADPQAGEQRLAHLDAMLRLSADLGLPRALVNIAGWNDPARRPLAAAALQQAALLANRYGVQLAVQARTAELHEAAGEVRRLNCPELALAVDTLGLSPEALRAANPVRLGAVLLRDARTIDERAEETALGRGEVDLPGIIGALTATEYGGAFTVRSTAMSGAAVDALRAGREYVENLLQGAPARERR